MKFKSEEDIPNVQASTSLNRNNSGQTQKDDIIPNNNPMIQS